MAVALIPVFFLLALAAGYLSYEAFGYQPENDDAPMWVDAVGSLASLVVLWVPCAAAVILGRRASRAGNRRAIVPIAIGAIVGIGFAVLSLVTVLQ